MYLGAVAQSVKFARGLRATEFVYMYLGSGPKFKRPLHCDIQDILPFIYIIYIFTIADIKLQRASVV
jgi:hypothetical protein